MGSPAYVESRDRVEEADRHLVERALDGDAAAFEAIVRSYQKRVYALAMRMTRRHEVADDVTQETFIRAYTRLAGFELGRPLAPWLLRIAANLSINYLTGVSRREQSVGDERGFDGLPAMKADPPAPDPLRSLLSSEFAQAVDEAVERLPVKQKAVFVLRVHEEMRYEQIAETLGISAGTVMSRLFRARMRLKEMLRDYI